jgi:hypothetical protein
MRVSPDATEVRQIVSRTFRSLGLTAKALAGLNETVLVSNGRYAARSYRVAGYLAMWLVEVGLLQFYDAQGNMLRTVNLFEEREVERLAA